MPATQERLEPTGQGHSGNGALASASVSLPEAGASPTASLDHSDEVVGRIGNLVRTLRESMKALGLDRAVERAAEIIPDARGRLSYIATMTEESADKVLNAVDRAQPFQDSLSERSKALNAQWDAWFQNTLDEAAVRNLVLDTREFIESVPASTDATNKELLEITLAQDFQDLTGQVVKKLMELVMDVEHQLLDLIVDSMYPEQDREEIRQRIAEQASRPAGDEEDSLLNGPQINPDADQAVSSQDQVDDLLDELGF